MASRLDEIVRKLAKRVKRHPQSLLTWFDDAGAVKVGDRYVVVKVDGFAASRALYPWCTFRDFGFRGVTGAVSDVIAKGCRPAVYAISLGVKPEHVEFIEDVFKGVEEAVDFYGGYIENVDTNVGYDDWIDIFVIGECSTQPIQRYAKPLDALIIPRRLGLSVIAYTEYTEKRVPLHEEVREFSCRPRTCIEIVSVIEECRTCIDGSIDISDTFAEALHQLSEVSNTGFYIYQNPLNMLHHLTISYAKSRGVDLVTVALASNEEYIPILIVKPGYEEHVTELLRKAGLEPIPIGFATHQKSISWLGKPVPKTVWDYVSGTITPFYSLSEASSSCTI
jgi:thiamine-monophosphate kinase